jgi:predicted nucleotidyltransferase
MVRREQKVAKDEIIQLLQAYQAQARALGVKRLGLFGSFVRGEARPDSDVDFLVEFEPGRKAFDNFIQFNGLSFWRSGSSGRWNW